jgi:hypothetical protein
MFLDPAMRFDVAPVHESRPERDVTRRYISALTLSGATQTGLLKTRVFNRIELFAHTGSQRIVSALLTASS